MTDNKILDKIRKLKAHADSAAAIGSEAEAQAFAQMVNALLNKHRLEMTDIQFEEERKNEPVEQSEIDFYVYGSTHRGKPVDWKHKKMRVEWIEKLAMIVAKAHSCEILVAERSNRLWLVGSKTNREIAEYVLVTLMRAAEGISYKEYLKYFYKMRDLGRVEHARGYRHAWLIGFINRIAARFDEEKTKMQNDATGTALVRFDASAADVRNFMASNFNMRAKSVTKSIHNHAGYVDGTRRADDINLSANAMRGSEKQSQIS